MFRRKVENLTKDYQVINNIRCLAIDMIDNANSGHPGMCLSASTIVWTLFSRHLNIYPADKNWYNRDRFVLSAGHGVPMLYACLYMLSYISLDDCRALRQLNSITPGHPEIKTPGIDMSTGPLGEGIASAVGMAIAERYLNTLNKNLFNHYTYVLCGDGDLMEGVSYEALSLAGHLKLNKLIILYDANSVTLDGDLSKSSDEDVITRFKAINFDIYTVLDGDSVIEIDEALKKAKKSLKPSIIIIKTKIGKYSVNEGSNVVHGKPLSKEDISNIKNKLDIYDTPFTVSNEAKEYFNYKVLERVKTVYHSWARKYDNLKETERERFKKIIENKTAWIMGDLDVEYKDMSLRDISSKILNSIANSNELVMGGSADLSSSCKTYLENLGTFDNTNYHGRNIYFGVREHAMAAIMNGMALSGLRPFGSTFLVFSDYMRGAIRMSAMMNLPVLYILTHDSITVGEEGASHEPIEQEYSLEIMPNMFVYHPMDVNELISSYKDIYASNHPSILILPRDGKKVSELSKSNKIQKGAYILKNEESDEFITLLGSGECVHTLLEVADELSMRGIHTRVVSMPCFNNFKKESVEYQNKIIPKAKKTIALTYGVRDKYYYWTKDVIGVDSFGLSGKKDDILDFYGLSNDKVLESVLTMIGEKSEK